MASFPAHGLISSRGQPTNRLSATIQHSDLNIQPFMPIPNVPTPVSWLSDIADHIKQLKQMNDLQRDQVYQLYLTLSQREARTNPAHTSLRESSSKSDNCAKDASSTSGYIISEHEAESTQN